MPFVAPKSSAFKQFVVLDHDGVVAALSAIDGGQIDEILQRSALEGSGSVGGEVDVKVAKGRAKRAKTRKVEEEMRLARTRHATAAKLIEALTSRDAVGIVEGALDTEVMAQVETGMVLQFRGEIALHPLHQADAMLRSFIDVAPSFDQADAARELKKTLRVWEALIGTGKADSRILTEPKTSEAQRPRLLLPIPKQDIEVPLDDLRGDLSILAQVERMIGEGSEGYQAIRMLRGGPETDFERDTVAEHISGLLPALKGIGIELRESDIFIGGPAVILRPICAYR